jgi:hypothetical protein
MILIRFKLCFCLFFALKRSYLFFKFYPQLYKLRLYWFSKVNLILKPNIQSINS